MNRRDLIKNIAILTAASFVGADLFLVGCKSDKRDNFTPFDINFFDEVAETIIPKTETPGAKDAETGKFMALFATDCYNDTDKENLRKGITKMNEASENKFGSSFMEITKTQKQELLIVIDADAKKYNRQKREEEAIHYFTMMKQLTLLGFFTSEAGATQVLRYKPVPGKYEGSIPYKKGEKSWA
ncbi:MAG TPA: gluconate 2-dehydrogenase subunit 3 family protein [Flavobacterium sp.]|uniref:gluconate 2-dehydrogenase subunit 3 family protein n=1 Tax=Flavobacterium sp. TaxID=239 RepID=UPI002F422715